MAMKYTALDHDPNNQKYLVGDSNGDIKIWLPIQVESFNGTFEVPLISHSPTVDFAMYQPARNENATLGIRQDSLDIKPVRMVGWNKSTFAAFDFVDKLWYVWRPLNPPIEGYAYERP